MANRDFLKLLLAAQATNQSNLCIGLDPNPELFPGKWKDDRRMIYPFCRGVIHATSDLVLAYKPQFAYFAKHAAEGQLEETIERIGRVQQPPVPVILDAKRGDIGDTAQALAAEAFERYQADAVTLSPYLGPESLMPYTYYQGKGFFPLCRTSNKGSDVMQVNPEVNLDKLGKRMAVEQYLGHELESPFLPLYLWVAYLAATEWSSHGHFGLVTGATHPIELKLVREMAPRLPLLVPGYGKQGATAHDAMSVDCPDAPAVVVAARSILYPPGVDPASFTGREEDYFSEVVRPAAIKARNELNAARPNLTTA